MLLTKDPHVIDGFDLRKNGAKMRKKKMYLKKKKTETTKKTTKASKNDFGGQLLGGCASCSHFSMVSRFCESSLHCLTANG